MSQGHKISVHSINFYRVLQLFEQIAARKFGALKGTNKGKIGHPPQGVGQRLHVDQLLGVSSRWLKTLFSPVLSDYSC